MSHLAAIDLVIKESHLDILADVLGKEFDAELRRGQTTHAFYGTFVGDYRDARYEQLRAQGVKPGTCDHAIRLKDHRGGDYEVGLVKSGDGYVPVFDFWGPGAKLAERFGKDGGKLKDHFGAEIALRHARRAGQRARKTIEADGSVVVDIVVEN